MIVTHVFVLSIYEYKPSQLALKCRSPIKRSEHIRSMYPECRFLKRPLAPHRHGQFRHTLGRKTLFSITNPKPTFLRTTCHFSWSCLGLIRYIVLSSNPLEDFMVLMTIELTSLTIYINCITIEGHTDCLFTLPCIGPSSGKEAVVRNHNHHNICYKS